MTESTSPCRQLELQSNPQTYTKWKRAEQHMQLTPPLSILIQAQLLFAVPHKQYPQGRFLILETDIEFSITFLQINILFFKIQGKNIFSLREKRHIYVLYTCMFSVCVVQVCIVYVCIGTYMHICAYSYSWIYVYIY